MPTRSAFEPVRLSTPRVSSKRGDYRFEYWPPFKDDLARAQSDALARVPTVQLNRHLRRTLTDIGVPPAQIRRAIGPVAATRIQLEPLPADWYARTASVQPNIARRARQRQPRRTSRVDLLWRVLGLSETLVLQSVDRDFPLVFLSLHCPSGTGASCTYSDSTTRTGSAGFTLQILGVKGGGQGKLTITAGTDYKAGPGEHYAVEKLCTFRIERCVEEFWTGRRGIPYTRATPIAVEDGYSKTPLSAADDPCETPALRGAQVGQVRLATAPTGDQKVLKIGAAKTTTFGIEIAVPQFQTKAGIQVEVSASSDKSLTYALPGMNTYTYFGLPREFGYAWTVS
jgi:hypothetical protein